MESTCGHKIGTVHLGRCSKTQLGPCRANTSGLGRFWTARPGMGPSLARAAGASGRGGKERDGVGRGQTSRRSLYSARKAMPLGPLCVWTARRTRLCFVSRWRWAGLAGAGFPSSPFHSLPPAVTPPHHEKPYFGRLWTPPPPGNQRHQGVIHEHHLCSGQVNCSLIEGRKF